MIIYVEVVMNYTLVYYVPVKSSSLFSRYMFSGYLTSEEEYPLSICFRVRFPGI